MSSVLYAPPRSLGPASAPAPSRTLPPRIDSGPWQTGHVQGIAVDQEKGFVYFSFTTMLVKTDLRGAVVGSVTGFTGHLGDVDFNPGDGRVYGSLEYKAEASFHVAVFDVDRITRSNLDAETDGVLTTVCLKEVGNDFTAAVGGDGGTRRHRYGCSGIDGISFGPTPGDPTGPWRLMVAYGIYSDTHRTDNDYQVLLQYDTARWREYERPLYQSRPHSSGPAAPDNKFFVFTGNTRFGVQNLKYDSHTGHWFMGVYRGAKEAFPNYPLFLIDGTHPPVKTPLRGQPEPEWGKVLQLHRGGLHDAASGIHGWELTADVGIAALGGGYYYLSEQGTASASGRPGHTSTLRLHRWTGGVPAPMEPVLEGV